MNSEIQNISHYSFSQQIQLRRRNDPYLTHYVGLSRSRRPSEEVTLAGNLHSSWDMLGERKPSYQEDKGEDYKSHNFKRTNSHYYTQSHQNYKPHSIETPTNLKLPGGSHIWGVNENDGQINTSPFSSPGEGRLLGLNWSMAEITPYGDMTDRTWKNHHVQSNKIGSKFYHNNESCSGEGHMIKPSEEEKTEKLSVCRAQKGLRVEENRYDDVQQIDETDTARIYINPIRPRRVVEEQSGQNGVNSLRQTNTRQLEDVGAQVQPHTSSRQISERLEARLYLQKVLPFFMTSALISGCLFLVIIKQYPLECIFAPADIYLLIYGAQSIIKTRYVQRESWRRREDIFDFWEALSGFLFLILVQLKIKKLIAISTVALIPFFITACAYYILSKASKANKMRNFLIRCFYAIQVFFITAKVDNIISWDWSSVFAFSFIFMSVMGLYCAAYCLLFAIALLFSLFKQRFFEDMSQFRQYIGLFWHILTYGLGVVGFFLIIGIQQVETAGGNFELLKFALIGGIGLGGFLVIFTLLAFRPLTEFIKALNRMENLAVSSVNPENTEKQIKLEVEKKESYFVMLSSTYFLPMNKNFFTKNEKKIQKIKAVMLSNLMPWKIKDPIQTKEDTPVSIEALKGYKEDLDVKLTKIANQSGKQGHNRCRRSSKQRNPTMKVNVFRTYFLSNHNESPAGSNTVRSNQKIHLSADDINVKGLTEESQKIDEKDMLCYLCWSNTPNAVLMKCGHGGICYDCASVLIMKKNECMECRGPVDEIYKVDPHPKLSNIIKGVELCKVNVI